LYVLRGEPFSRQSITVVGYIQTETLSRRMSRTINLDLTRQ
jgi:hypothetical protein